MSKTDVTSLVLPVGDGGDEPDPSHTGLHVLLSRHHQRQGQRRAQDLLCAYGDDPLNVPRECNAVRLVQKILKLHKRQEQMFIKDGAVFCSLLLHKGTRSAHATAVVHMELLTLCNSG